MSKKPLTVSDYQATCVALNVPGNPVLFGLFEETGELVGKYKKLVRDDAGVLTVERRSAMIYEAGDVLWHVAMLAHEQGIALATMLLADAWEDWSRTCTPNGPIDPEAELRRLASAAGILMGVPVLGQDAACVLLLRMTEALNRLAKWLGVSVEEIAQTNLDKLHDRVARGVVRGSGDYR